MEALNRTYVYIVQGSVGKSTTPDRGDVHTSARSAAQPRQSGETTRGHGSCLTCYAAGQFVQAADPIAGSLCATHLRDPARPAKPPPDWAPPEPDPEPIHLAGPNPTRPPAGRPGNGRPPGRAGNRVRRGRKPTGRFHPPPIDPADFAVDMRALLDQRDALARFDTHPDTAGWRADRWRNWRAVWRVLTRRINWNTATITTTHRQLAEAASELLGEQVSEATVRRVLAWARCGCVACLEEHQPGTRPGVGLLHLVESGKSAAAMRTRMNRAPTYVILAAADATNPQVSGPVDVIAHPTEPRSGSVLVIGGNSLYEDNHRKTRTQIRTRAVPQTTVERRTAAEYLRRRALIGTVPTWRLAAMLARHFAAGRSVADVWHMLERRPNGSPHLPLPCGDGQRAAALERSPKTVVVDMLLGMIGGRLNLWRDTPGPGLALPGRLVHVIPPPAPPATLTSRGQAARTAARAVAARILEPRTGATP